MEITVALAPASAYRGQFEDCATTSLVAVGQIAAAVGGAEQISRGVHEQSVEGCASVGRVLEDIESRQTPRAAAGRGQLIHGSRSTGAIRRGSVEIAGGIEDHRTSRPPTVIAREGV